MIPCWVWNVLSQIKDQHGFIFIGVGDWGQLPAVEDDEDIELDRTWVVKHIFNTRWYELTETHRSTDHILNEDAKKVRNKQTIDFTKYNNKEHDLAICHTNDMVDAINKKWNEHYAETKDKQIVVDGLKHRIYYLG